MFQFSGFASPCLCIQHGMTGLQPAGLPHSEIHGSMLVCSSPWLIAAYHVLHRLSMPRHPPYALTYLSSAILHGPSLRLLTLLWTRYFFAIYICATEQLSCQRTNFQAVPTPCGFGPTGNGGVSRDRTGDPLLAKQVLYHLSYNPA